MIMMPLVADDRARLFRLARDPHRIVSLAPNATEVLLALGLADRLVGADEHSELPAGLPCVRVGGFKATDVAHVTALQPELVVAASIHIGWVVPALEAAGHAVLVLWPRSVLGLLRSVLRLGSLLGVASAATTLVRPLETRAQRITEALLKLSPERHTAGPGTFLDDVISRAGGINLGAAARVEWPVLPADFILRHDPDVVVLATYAGSATPTQ
jgi:iron complex transport system substrate-binding protein